MIYLDHAATSYPKIPSVQRATVRALSCYAANPGRGGYAMALAAAEQLYACRESAAVLFGVSDARRVVFTLNCTQALNTVIKSVLDGGGRVIVSELEHNAVMRPLHALSPRHPLYDTARVTPMDEDATVEAFRKAIGPQTRAIVCTHVSNVTGCVLPVARLAMLAHENGIPLIVDAAQSAGHLPIDMERDGIDYVCAAGHKGLGGPMGTGLLLCREESLLRPLIEGGTGSNSLSLEQPAELPERLESGTPNVAGICGLHAGIERVRTMGVERIETYERALGTRLYDGMCEIPRIVLFSPRPCAGYCAPVISARMEGMSVEMFASVLAEHGVAVRGGLHCAPAAHRSLGTLPEGTVRFSIGAANTMQEIENVLQILKKISRNALLFR